MSGPSPHRIVKFFLEALKDLGYVEGRNLILERRSAEGRLEEIPNVVAEVVRLKVDVIVSSTNAITRAAKDATTTLPIVMFAGAAPVEAGLVAHLARPGGNVTGISADLGGALHGKRLELLKEAVPRISRVAFLGHPLVWDAPPAQNVRAMARSLGLTLFLAAYTSGTDVTPAFPIITRERADAIFVAGSPTTAYYRRQIIEFANANRLPACFVNREAVDEGALMYYGSHDPDLMRLTAVYVDKILKGAQPRDLPIEQPSKFQLVINLKTAKTLGLTIPPSLLQRADQVIE
jgi:putative ABC transport system substrate-binding protein